MKKQNKRFHILGRKEGRKEGRKAYNALTKSPLALFSCLIFLFAAFLFVACDSDDAAKLGFDIYAKSKANAGTRPAVGKLFDTTNNKGTKWGFSATLDGDSFSATLEFTGYDQVTGFIKAKVAMESIFEGVTEKEELDAFYFPSGDNGGCIVIFNKNENGQIDYSKVERTPCEFVAGDTEDEDLIVITCGELTKVGGDSNNVIGTWTGEEDTYTYTYWYEEDPNSGETKPKKDNNNAEYTVTITSTASVTINSDGTFSYTSRVSDAQLSDNDPKANFITEDSFKREDPPIEGKITKNVNGVLYGSEDGVELPAFYYSNDGKLMRAMMALQRMK